MKLMRIHYCGECKHNRHLIETDSIRVRCSHPDVLTKKGWPRILNKRLIMRGQFPKICPLEDADFNIPKVADKGYNHEKTV